MAETHSAEKANAAYDAAEGAIDRLTLSLVALQEKCGRELTFAALLALAGAYASADPRLKDIGERLMKESVSLVLAGIEASAKAGA